LISTPARAQDGDGMEEFEAVDPYTKGEKELMDRLGYASFGPFQWRKGDTTTDVQRNMGGIPMLWVETEHFRIGSTLGTYELPGDRDEKNRVEEELDRLEERLGKLKAPKRKLDPWLRLHLYAQRAEELYDSFMEEFSLEPADFEDSGPHLGRSEKFLLLLCQRKSEYSRHMKTYLDVQSDTSYRWRWTGGTSGFAVNVEAIRESWHMAEDKPYDSILYGQVVSALASGFVEGYRESQAGAPYWLSKALGHYMVRRIDPRWVSGIGTVAGQSIEEDDYKWEPRVRNLVGNDFFATTEEMFGWRLYTDMNVRDHMVVWSKLQYLLTEVDGDDRAFLTDVCLPPPTGSAEQRRAAMLQRQTAALQEHYGLTPQELDDSWARWVKKTYQKR
jgi:hypothetical protein